MKLNPEEIVIECRSLEKAISEANVTINTSIGRHNELSARRREFSPEKNGGGTRSQQAEANEKYVALGAELAELESLIGQCNKTVEKADGRLKSLGDAIGPILEASIEELEKATTEIGRCESLKQKLESEISQALAGDPEDEALVGSIGTKRDKAAMCSGKIERLSTRLPELEEAVRRTMAPRLSIFRRACASKRQKATAKLSEFIAPVLKDKSKSNEIAESFLLPRSVNGSEIDAIEYGLRNSRDIDVLEAARELLQAEKLLSKLSI